MGAVPYYNANNAWCSPSQSNTKASGNFTGITTFSNTVIAFKNDYVHEIYNNKNPFRVQDIYADGTIDNKSIQEVDGKLFYVSKNGVKVFTHGKPKLMSYELDVNTFKRAVSGTDNRKYYLYCETDKKLHNLFVYDTYIGQWSEESIESEVISFSHNKNGMYCLCKDGNIYRLDSKDYSHQWSAETDFYIGKTIDMKSVKKIQILAEIPVGSKIDVYLLYDGEELNANTQKVYSCNGKAGLIPIRITSRNSSNFGFKIHIKGYGYVKLYQMEIFTQQGGELYV